MLVLSRRPGEEIVIDGGIRVRVLATTRGVVRLAITAPPTVVVDRAEVHARRQAVPALPAVAGRTREA